MMCPHATLEFCFMIESSVPEVQRRALNCAILEEKVSVAEGLKALNLELTKLTGQRRTFLWALQWGTSHWTLGLWQWLSQAHIQLCADPRSPLGNAWGVLLQQVRVPVCHCHSIALNAAAAPPALPPGFVHCPSLLVKDIFWFFCSATLLLLRIWTSKPGAWQGLSQSRLRLNAVEADGGKLLLNYFGDSFA